MKPTVIGQRPVSENTTVPPSVVLDQVPVAATIDLAPVTTENLPVPVATNAIVAVSATDALALVPVTLTPEQQRLVLERVTPLNIRNIASLTIAGMGSEADRNLAAVLDKFLALVDRSNDPELFTLYGKIGKAVDDAKLGELADKILSGEASLGDKVLGMLKRASPAEMAQKAHIAVTQLLKEKTGTLKDVVDKSTAELEIKLAGLKTQVLTLESLNQAYGERIVDFTLATALTRVFVEMSRPVVAQAVVDLANTVNPGPDQVAYVEELKSRLETAESVALTREASLTKIPADQEVIRQIQQAGVTTYIQTLVTAGARTNSIKTTLLQLHGANMVRGVQALNAQGAALEKNLDSVSRRLTKQVAQTASTMAGDTLEAQAAKIHEIIAHTAEVKQIVEAGRKQNATKFLAVSASLKSARAELVKLGNTPPTTI